MTTKVFTQQNAAIPKTLDHTSGAYVEREGAQIYYEVAGQESGPALVLLHGGMGTLEDFQSILPDLLARYKIIGIDSRGHGRSTLHGPVTYAHMQKDVEGILAHLGIQNVTLMGFSDGGTVAYRLAAMSSIHVENLVTIGAHWHVKNMDSMKEFCLKITGESWRQKFPHTYELYQKLNPTPDFDGLVQSVIHLWLDPHPSGYPYEAVQKITCPTLVVRGEDDHLCLEQDARQVAGLIQNARLIQIPSAGHQAFEDQKDIFMTHLNGFLGREQ